VYLDRYLKPGITDNHEVTYRSLGIDAVSAFLAALVAALMTAKPVAAPPKPRYIHDASL
jgi:hypothetical protein